MSPLKIWTEMDLTSFGDGVGFIELLFPFCGQSDFERDRELNVLAGRYDVWEQEGQRHLELTTLEEADIAVFPVSYPLIGLSPQLQKAAANFSEKVEKAGKRTLVFVGGDEDIVDVQLPRPIVFHKSLYASKCAAHEFCVTEYIEDLVARYSSTANLYREKSAQPSVGFCGFAPPLGVAWSAPKLKATARLLLNYLGVMRRQPSRSGHSYRARALLSLLRQKKVATDFLIRDQFAFAGAHGQLQPGGTSQSAERMRKEYVDNILRNDYNVCVRGIANDSIRLFETLCCGRIPVFVNTDCVLPYDFAIDWRRHVVWVEEHEIDKVPRLVAQFHDSLSDDEFVALQKSNRKLWEEFLSPQGFFKKIPLCLAEANRRETREFAA